MDKQAGFTSGAANINTAALSPALQSLHSSVASSRDLSPVNPAFLLRASAPGLVAEGRSSTAQGRSRFPSPGASAMAKHSHPTASARVSDSGRTSISGASSTLFPLSRARTENGAADEWPVPGPLPVPMMLHSGSEALTVSELAQGGYDLDLVDQYLSLLTGDHQHGGSRDLASALGPGMPRGSIEFYKAGIGREYPNLAKLGLDKATLQQTGVAPHHMNRLYKSLYANAAAFSRIVNEEQARLGTIVQRGNEDVCVADRVMAYIMGVQAPFKHGEVEPVELPLGQASHQQRQQGQQQGEAQPSQPVNLEDWSPASDVMTRRSTAAAASSAHRARFEEQEQQERQQEQQQGQGQAPASPSRPGSLHGRGGVTVTDEQRAAMLSPEAVMDVERAAELAKSNNVVGLHRLLVQYRAAYQLAREQLLKRIEHEAGRATRAQGEVERVATELKGVQDARDGLAEELAAQAEAIRGLQRRVVEQSEEMVAMEAVEDSLRQELAAMEAHWEAQLAEASARVTEQLEALQRQSDGQSDLREQYLSKVKEVVALQLRLDGETRRAARAAADAAAAKEAAGRASRELATVQAWVARSEQRVQAAEDLTTASDARTLDAEFKLAKEKEAHMRTRGQLGKVLHRVEQARCVGADVQSKAVKHISHLTSSLHEMTLRSARFERQLQEALEVAKMRTFEAESAKAYKKTAKEAMERAIAEQKATESKLIEVEQDLAAYKHQLDALAKQLAEKAQEAGELTTALRASEAEVEERGQRLAEVAEYEKEREGSLAKVAFLEERVANTAMAYQVLEAKYAMLQAAAELSKSKEEELMALQKGHAELQQQHGELAQKHEATAVVLAAATGHKADLSAELEAAKRLLDAKNVTLQDVTDRLTDAEARYGAERDALVLASTQLEVTRQLLDKAQEHIQQLNDEIATLKLMEQVIADLRAEVAELETKLKSSEAARCSALADREWWTAARQHLSLEMKELNAFSDVEAERLQALFNSTHEKLQQLQGQMLGLGEDAPQGPGSLAAQDNRLARDLTADLQALMQRLTTLLKNEESIKEGIEAQVQSLQGQMEERLAKSNQFWQSCLDAARVSPEGLSTYMIETANMRLDPLSPLASLVPVGLLEQQHGEIMGLKGAIGRVRGEREGVFAQCQALEDCLESERRSADLRDERYTALIAQLQSDIAALRSDAKGLVAARQMHERLSAQLGRRVQEAEWAVTKAREREVQVLAAAGLASSSEGAGGLAAGRLVPLGRVDRGVQTVYSELWVAAPPSTWGEASRRAMTPNVPSWGGDLGSGSVALPPLSSLSATWGNNGGGPLGGFGAFGVAASSAATSMAGSPRLQGTGRPASPGASRPMLLGASGSSSPARTPPVGANRGSSPQITNHHYTCATPPDPARRPSTSPTANHAPHSPLWNAASLDSRPASSTAWSSWLPPQGVTNTDPGALESTEGTFASVGPAPGMSPMGGTHTGMPHALWSVVLSGAEFQKQRQQQQQQGEAQDEREVRVMYNWDWDWVRELEAAGQLGGPAPGTSEEEEGAAGAGAGGGPAGPPPLPLLSVAETLDVITTIYMSKVQDDAASTAGGTLPRTLRQYVGWYFIAAYRLGTDDALRCLAQFAASVRAHAAVYEAKVFGRHVGLLPASGGTGAGAPVPAAVATAAAAAAAIRRSQESAASSQAASAAARGVAGRVGSPYLATPQRAVGGGLKKSSPPGSAAAGTGTAAARAAAARSRVTTPATPSRPPPHSAEGAGQQRSGSGSLGPWDKPGSTASATQTTAPFAELAFTPMAPGASALPPLEAKVVPALDVNSICTPELTAAMDQLMTIPGMDSLMRFMAAGQFASSLRTSDFGPPLPEAASPELHYVLMEACRCLGLDICPELVECEALSAPGYHPVALLQLPHSPAAAPGKGGSGGGGNKAGSASAASGWKRRAVLLVRPGLLAALRPEEAQAALAGALAPMCLPGGGGWKLELEGPSGSGLGAGAGASASAGGVEIGGWKGEAGARGQRVALADAVTAANLGAVQPQAIVSQLPKQQQVKWDRLHAPLWQLVSSAQGSCDRVALLVVQQLGPVLRAIYKSAAGAADEQCPEGQELEAEARATLATGAGTLAGGVRVGSAADEVLARMAALCAWHDGEEYTRMLQRSGATLRQVVDVGNGNAAGKRRHP